jgi:hypothetical protein
MQLKNWLKLFKLWLGSPGRQAFLPIGISEKVCGKMLPTTDLERHELVRLTASGHKATFGISLTLDESMQKELNLLRQRGFIKG